MVDKTSFFNISKGKHSVKVLAKPGALKKGAFYNGIYNVVIKVTPNSKFNFTIGDYIFSCILANI